MDLYDEANRIANMAAQKRYRKEAAKEKVRKKVHNAVHWMADKADVVAVATPFCVYSARALTGVVRDVRRSVNLRKERNLKELYCYDRSLGHYWELRRKLSNREWVEIDKRRRKGEKLGEILKMMNVLK